MHPMVARAFAANCLTWKQREDLQHYEKKNLPDGRYLLAFEICRMFKIAPKTIPENEVEQMQQLWDDFERRFLWGQQQTEDVLYPNVDVRSKLDEIHEWENFALANFGAELRTI